MPVVATPDPSALPENLVYVSDVRLFQGESANENASQNGYKLVDENLNEGADKTSLKEDLFASDYGDTPVYLGYKTTTDRSQAITSLKMAEMDTGYQMFDYDELEKSMNTGMNYVAEDIIAVLPEIKKNIERGDRYAGKVKEALNLFYVPYMDNKGVGDFLFDPETSVAKVAQLLKRCNMVVTTSMFSDLMMGVSGTPIAGQSGNLASRIVQNAKTIDGMDKGEYITLDSLYKDDAKDLRQTLQNYSNEIEPALKLYQEEGSSLSQAFMDAHPSEALTMQVYNTLNEYTIKDGTGVGTYLYRLGTTTMKDKADLRALYPLVMAMSPGQLLLLQYTGIFDAVTYMNESSEAISTADEVVEKTKERIKNSGLKGTEDGRLPIYPPGQDALYRSRVALTTEAIRSASAREEYHKITQYEKDMELWNKVYTWSNRIIVFSMAACVLATGVVWIIGHTSARWLLTTAAFQVLTKLGWPIRLLGSNMYTFIIMIVVIIIWYAVLEIKKIIKYYDPDRSEVPRYMYSVEKVAGADGKKENEYILYEPAYSGYTEIKYKENNNRSGSTNAFEREFIDHCEDYEDINYNDSSDVIAKKEEHNKKLFSDFNAREGKKWNALYKTKDPRAGSPICAESEEDLFRVIKGQYNEYVSGYKPFSSFGNENPVNLNSNQYHDRVGGIYLYYKTEETLRDPEACSYLSKGKYVSDVILISEKEEKDANAAIKMKAGKYRFLDTNLTPNQGYCTYIGYSVTENVDDAIRDLRVDSIAVGNSMSGGYRRNNIGYAGVGQTANGSYTLYQTAVNKGDTDISDRESLRYTEEDDPDAEKDSGTEPEKSGTSTIMSYSGAPILADFKVVESIEDAPAGYEPIIAGCGGAAFNFNTRYKKTYDNNRRYVYFQPAVAFVSKGADVKPKKGVTYVYSDEEYLAGVQAFVLAEQINFGKKGERQEVEDFKNRIRGRGYTLFDLNINERFRIFEDETEGKLRRNICYIGYATTRNPFRAIGDIRYFKGNTFSESIQSSAPSAEGVYLAMDVHVYGDPAEIGIGENIGYSTSKEYAGTGAYMIDAGYYYVWLGSSQNRKRTLAKERVESWQHAKVKNYLGVAERGLYVLGADAEHPALKPSDILVTNKSTPPAGMRSISYMTNPFMTENFDISPSQAGIHFYIRKEKEVRKKYVSGIYVASYSKPKKLSKEEDYFTYKAVDDSTKLAAYAGCNGEVLDTNLGVEPKYAWYNYLDADSKPVKKTREEYYYCGSFLDNKAKNYSYVGVSYTDDPDEALTGIIRYKFSGSTPPNRITIGGVKYYKAGDAVGNCCYYTTKSDNAMPGLPITDISFDETLSLGGSAVLLQTDRTDPSNLQQQLDAVDMDGDLEEYEKIRKKAELRNAAVNLKPVLENKLSGHLFVDTNDSFISDIILGHGKTKEEAIDNAIKNGATYVYSFDTNLGIDKTVEGNNKGLPFGSDSLEPTKMSGREYVCIGYNAESTQNGGDPSFGVHDILITQGKPFMEDGFEKDGSEYYPVSNVSLNAGTDGKELYMYYSFDETDKAASPLESLVMSKGDSIPSGVGEKRYEYIMTDTDEKANLNKGATSISSGKMQDTRLWLFAHRLDNTVKSEALFDITDFGRKTKRMDVEISS
ncbi:MAG: hypothetical protein IKQ97_04310, partial [Eubacterium sp.]|nr:hypothetical protein [Eubacterium sp.]